MDEHLPKPVSKDALLAMLARFCTPAAQAPQ
jgi:hypothetical protein